MLHSERRCRASEATLPATHSAVWSHRWVLRTSLSHIYDRLIDESTPGVCWPCLPQALGSRWLVGARHTRGTGRWRSGGAKMGLIVLGVSTNTTGGFGV